MSDAWMLEAPCSSSNTELFFKENKRSTSNSFEVRQAINICNSCDHKELCLETFINEQYGIFGGTTPIERQKIRSRRRRLAAVK
jgi:hypothetical protein